MNKFWTGEHDEPCRTHFVLAESTVILDRITSSDPSVTDYILESAAKCPNCRREILEKTLVGLCEADQNLSIGNR